MSGSCPAYLVAVCGKNSSFSCMFWASHHSPDQEKGNVQTFTIPLLFLQLHKAQTASHANTLDKSKSWHCRATASELAFSHADTQEVRFWKPDKRQMLFNALNLCRANMIFSSRSLFLVVSCLRVKCCCHDSELETGPPELLIHQLL